MSSITRKHTSPELNRENKKLKSEKPALYTERVLVYLFLTFSLSFASSRSGFCLSIPLVQALRFRRASRCGSAVLWERTGLD